MTTITLTTLSGASINVPDGAITALRSRMAGNLLLPDEDGYDAARTVWNAMIDKHPAMIALCANADDVAEAMRFARETGAMLSVKGGGHNIAGSAVCDGGMMIDLSGMNRVSVEPATARVHVQPGATLADIDAATAPHGLAVPMGINSTTGIAGLTLGGGFGWLTRTHGLTIDSLVAAEVITAQGERLRAAEDENSDLFWALRGGGGNFGIVTRFEFQAHPMQREVLSGLIFLPLERAREIFTLQRDMMRDGPDELSTWVILRHAPLLPFLPEAAHGMPVAIMAFCHVGDPQMAEAAIAPLRAIADPIALAAGAQPFTEWQKAFDPLLSAGARNYWKSHDLLDLGPAEIDMMIGAAGQLPDAESDILVAHLSGAMSRIAPDATAFVQRAPHFVVNIHTRWRDPAKDDMAKAWARGLFDALSPRSAGVYVNFMPAEESGRVADAYGANLARLSAIKAKYDPDNRLRLNQNIAPATPKRMAG